MAAELFIALRDETVQYLFFDSAKICIFELQHYVDRDCLSHWTAQHLLHRQWPQTT